MHNSSGRFIPNDFHKTDESQNFKSYTLNENIKGKIKTKNTIPMRDKTNEVSKKLQPILQKQNIKPSHIDLNIYQQQSSIFSSKTIHFQTIPKQHQKEYIKNQNYQTQNQNQQDTRNINLYVQKINHKQLPFQQVNIKNNFQSQEVQRKQKHQQKFNYQAKKKLFQICFSSQSSSSCSQQQNECLSVQAQQSLRSKNRKENYRRLEENKKQQLKKLIFQPNQSDLQQSQSQDKEIISAKIDKFQKDGQKSKFMIDFGQSDDDESIESQQSDFEQKIIITKTINIKNLIDINEDYVNTKIPQNSIISLIIKRQEKGQQYKIYDNNYLRHILTVKKDGRSLSRIFIRNMPKQSFKQIAKIKSNFFGTQFHCYCSKKSQNKNKKHIISIKYQTNILGLNGPRKMTIYTPSSSYVNMKYQNFIQLYENSQCKQDCGVQKYINKAPKWNQKINAYVLDFKGRATYSSVKNFVLIKSTNEKKQYVLFGKVGKDVFNLDLKHPFTIMQGIALGISSFQKKLGCE